MTSQAPLLVTGAAGFVGSAFVASCAKRGIPVVSVDRASYFAERTEHRGIDYGRIVDRDELFDWLGREKPRLSGIVHLGACANTMETDEAYLKRNNVEYSQMLWAHASDALVPFVYASSAATYGDGALGYDDDESLIPRLEPLNLYGRSKLLFDIWALGQEKRGVKLPAWAGFKFFNVYGPGERHKKGMASVVLHAYDQIRATGRMRLFRSHRSGIADGEQKRDFIWVGDVVNVLHFALEKPLARGIYNLGTGQARSFLDLARATLTGMGHAQADACIDFIDTPEAIRDKYQYFTQAEMARLRAQGYSAPFTSLEAGIAQYLEALRGQA
jgi:ADP-L-glycero-D-manno-heptose 6-epimerase